MNLLRAFAVFAIFTVAAASHAQTPPPRPAERMGELAFLHGTWRGEGWMMLGPDRRETFVQSERIGPFLGGDILLIEGQGRTKDPDARLVHHAFAAISPAPEGGYEFRSYAAGRAGTFHAELAAPGKFVWRIPAADAEIRYTITVEGDTWRETGERSVDGGRRWVGFFEMTLRREGPASW